MVFCTAAAHCDSEEVKGRERMEVKQWDLTGSNKRIKSLRVALRFNAISPCFLNKHFL